jgi:APA family basic amino acid/polyamine antiporter
VPPPTTAIATGAVGYLSEFAPWVVGTPFRTAAATLLVLWALTGVNCLGVRAAGWVQAITTVLKLLPLFAAMALLVGRLPALDWSAAARADFTLRGSAAAATLALWAMLGLESATIPADKVRDPAVTIPRATVWGTAATVVISALSCAAVLLLVPLDRVAGSAAPFAELARDAWGPGVAQVVSLFGAVSALGALNGWILLQGELPLAMARDGLFVQAFGRTSARGAPVVALVASSALATALVLINANRSLVGVFTFFVLLGTTANLVAYLASSLALVRLRWREAALGGRRGPAVAGLLGVLGTAYSLAALAGAGREAVVWGGLLLAAGIPMYVALGRFRAPGVWRGSAKRPDRMTNL